MSARIRDFRSFAIIPAAGRSRRMGQPKLLLPWRGKTIIESVIERWRLSKVDHVVVVVHREDSELIGILRRLPVEFVIPDVPPDEMKHSIACGLQYLDERHQPGPTDVWLVAPADLPQLAPAAINALLEAHASSPQSVHVPSAAGRDLHPVLFPWELAREVQRLKPQETLRTLIQRSPVVRVDVQVPDETQYDVDTPADYRRLTGSELPDAEGS